MRRALMETIIIGPATTIPFHQQILNDSRFLDAQVHTGLVEIWLQEQAAELAPDKSVGPVGAAAITHANGKEPR